MHTSRFQLGLITTLAVGLGFSLSSSDAVGYPAGAAVGLGANPVSSAGGELSSGMATTVFSADASGPFLITDVVFTAHPCSYYSDNMSVSIVDSSTGGTLAAFRLTSDSDGGSTDAGTNQAIIRDAYSSGLAIPAGTSAFIQHSGCGTVAYSMSGYQAQG